MPVLYMFDIRVLLLRSLRRGAWILVEPYKIIERRTGRLGTDRTPVHFQLPPSYSISASKLSRIFISYACSLFGGFDLVPHSSEAGDDLLESGLSRGWRETIPYGFRETTRGHHPELLQR